MDDGLVLSADGRNSGNQRTDWKSNGYGYRRESAEKLSQGLSFMVCSS